MYCEETTWCARWKIPLENPWKHHFWDSKFQNVLRRLGPKTLWLWCEFQSRLQFIISLLLKNFSTALVTPVLWSCLVIHDLHHISCRYFGHTSLVCLQIWRACHWTEYIPCYACLRCKIPPPASAVWMTWDSSLVAKLRTRNCSLLMDFTGYQSQADSNHHICKMDTDVLSVIHFNYWYGSRQHWLYVVSLLIIHYSIQQNLLLHTLCLLLPILSRAIIVWKHIDYL